MGGSLLDRRTDMAALTVERAGFARRRSEQPVGMASALERAVAVPFRLGSALRGARVFHPQGFLCRGTWRVRRGAALAPDAAVLGPGTEHECLVRLSRGAGLPEALPDWFGLTVRLENAYGPGRHQDLLLNSSAGAPLVRHLFLPAARWFAQAYSTCLPYRAGAGPFLILLEPPAEPGPEPSLAGMRAAVARRPRFEIAVAGSAGRRQRIGQLELRDPLPPDTPDVDFDPWNTGGGLKPATRINELRREAYRQSRRGRGRPSARRG
jgi:hypothetical protein